MRIGIMLRSLEEQGGVGIYTRYLLHELLEADDRNEYVLFYANSERLGTYASRRNVSEQVVRAANKALWDQLSIPYACAKAGVDVVLHPKFTAPLLAPCKTVMTLHGADWFITEHARFYSRMDVWYMKLMTPLYLRKCDRVLSVSKITTSEFERIFSLPPGKIRTTYFGPARHFRRVDDPSIRQAIRAKYHLPPQFILTLSGYDRGKRKNIDRILEAYRLYHGRTPHALVVGGKDCVRFKADYGIPDEGYGRDISFPGWIDQEDLPAVYSMASVYLYPSNLEAFPIPLTEAMACGTPIITSSLNGLKEIAGDAALFVDADEPRSIADGVEQVLTNPWLESELRAKATARSQLFSWQKCARETLETLESLGETTAGVEPAPPARNVVPLAARAGGSGLSSTRNWTFGAFTNVGSLSAGRLAADSLWFLFVVALCRRFGPPEVGKFAFAFAISAMAYAAATVGLEDYGIRDYPRLHREGRSRLLGCLLTCEAVLMGPILLVVLGLLVLTRASAETSAIIVLLAVYQISLAAARTLFIPQVSSGSVAKPVIGELVCRALGVVLGVWLIFAEGSTAVIAALALPAAGLLLLAVAARSLVRHGESITLNVSWLDVAEVVREAWTVTSADVVFPFYARTDVILILWIVGSTAAGVYAAALEFLELGFVPLFLFGAVTYPALSAIARRPGSDVAALVERLARSCLFLSGLIAWAMVFVVSPVAVALLGRAFDGVTFLVTLMAVLLPLMAVEIVASRVLLASQLRVTRVTGQWWATVISVLLSMALVPRFGMLAAIASAVIGLLVLDGLYLGAIRRAAIPLRAFWRSVQAFLGPAAAAILVAWLCSLLRAPTWSIAAASLMAYTASAAVADLVSIDVRSFGVKRHEA